MGSGPAPFSDIGKRARDLLTRDYNYDQKFSVSMSRSTGLGLTATGINKDQIFLGDISTQYKSGNTVVDVKIDTYSNVFTKVFLNEILPSTKVGFSYSIPDQKLGKLDVQYLHCRAAINSSIGLNPTPLLELATAFGSKNIVIGGEIGFDTASSSFTKCSIGMSINQPDYSAALIVTDKGQTVKASYIHTLNASAEVAAEMTYRKSKTNSFSIGSAHVINPWTTVKTRFCDNGQVAMLYQHEWRPKSLITFSTEYDSKATHTAPKFGLALALKP